MWALFKRTVPFPVFLRSRLSVLLNCNYFKWQAERMEATATASIQRKFSNVVKIVKMDLMLWVNYGDIFYWTKECETVEDWGWRGGGDWASRPTNFSSAPFRFRSIDNENRKKRRKQFEGIFWHAAKRRTITTLLLIMFSSDFSAAGRLLWGLDSKGAPHCASNQFDRLVAHYILCDLCARPHPICIRVRV